MISLVIGLTCGAATGNVIADFMGVRPKSALLGDALVLLCCVSLAIVWVRSLA